MSATRMPVKNNLSFRGDREKSVNQLAAGGRIRLKVRRGRPKEMVNTPRTA
jgi:hypothetical protein